MSLVNSIPLADANRIIAAGLRLARSRRLQPLTLAILDKGGYLVSAEREDDSSILRFEIAFGKAWSCLALGHSTRYMEEEMARRPHFLDSLAAAAGGKFVPAIGGILIRDAAGRLVGALGVTGDAVENDEAVGVQAIEECGYQADLS